MNSRRDFCDNTVNAGAVSYTHLDVYKRQVEIHGAKVAYNGTKENPAYDSAIKSRSFTMTSGVICENYSGGGAGAIEINDGLKFVDDLDCRISGDSLIENCGSDT